MGTPNMFPSIRTIINFISGALTSAFLISLNSWIFSQIQFWHFLIFTSILGGSIYIAGKFGYLDRFSWIYTKKERLEKMMDVLQSFAQNSSSGASFTINDSNKSASMVYTRYGKQYILNTPFNRTLLGKMSQHSVILIKGEEEIDITQQPGVGYICSAYQLGGDKIVIKNKLEDLNVATFGQNEIPTFEKIK